MVIAAIDVPFQSHEFTKRMRMTKQEIKDEYKDVEGRPEVKAQIRRKQREMAEQRMMEIEERGCDHHQPDHFSVALVYDPESMGRRLWWRRVLILALRIVMKPKSTALAVEFRLWRIALYFDRIGSGRFLKNCITLSRRVIAYVFQSGQRPSRRANCRKPNPEIPQGFKFVATVIPNEKGIAPHA